MVINHLFPIFALIALGVLLKHFKITTDNFLSTSDRLIYYIFFPTLLFWKIGGSSPAFTPQILRFFCAALGAVLLVYVLSTTYILMFRVGSFQAGSFSQSCYRFNTYVGMAVILSAWGETSVALFGVLVGLAIPMINVLAVSTLIWFSGQSFEWRRRLRLTLMALVTNPLILACAAGAAYAQWINTFPKIVENTFQLGAAITLPLALLSIGGNLTFKNLQRYFPLALAGAMFKLIALPAIGWGLMQLWAVPRAYYPVGMLFFALPTSTAMYVLSSQLNSDTELASAAIVLSTVFSFFSMSAMLWWFNG